METPEQTVWRDDYHTHQLQIGLTAIVCNHCMHGAMLGEEIQHTRDCPEYGLRPRAVRYFPE